jgi:hypothetical protein
LYYEKIQSLVGMVSPQTVVEIGVAYGYHARHLLESNPESQYIGIDPYMADYKGSFLGDVARLFGCSAEEGMERLYKGVSEGLQKDFGSRARIIREPAAIAATQFGDLSLPFVFIDGDHRYKAVITDLKTWWPKIARGGVLCGDDYLMPDVRRAVLEFFQTEGCVPYLLQAPNNPHTSFYALKP